MTEQNNKRRISIGEAAEQLGVSKDTVRRLISRGDLDAYRIGTGERAPVRLDAHDVEACAHRVPTGRPLRGGGDQS